jgi:hypothetical protein
MESEKQLALVHHRAGKLEAAKPPLNRMKAAKKQIANTILSIEAFQRQIKDIDTTISTVRKRNTLAKGGRLTRRRRARTRRSH